MSSSSQPPGASRRVRNEVRPRPRRRHRPARNPIFEHLEARQVLSAGGQVAAIDQILAQTNLQLVPMVSNGPSGYSPGQIRNAYGVNQVAFSGGTVVGNGAGQTIAIVDAYNDPNISSDLARFDSQYGLAAPPSFTVKNLGAMTSDPGWALETSLDVEWAHAIAPKANIVLVEASTASLGALFDAASYASRLPGVSVVSMSWGTSEFWGEWNYDSLFTTAAGHKGVTFVASSGDSGAWSGPMYPSVSPNVLAVGGTTLTLGSNNNSYGSETGWTYSTGGFSGLDNGYWYGESMPSYQAATLAKAGLDYGIRTTPDVSFNADPNTGVAVYDSVSYNGQSGWFEVGGTSAAAPAWAGLVAIADQGLATAGKGSLTTAQVQSELYSLPASDFHDITRGFNGYFASPGYDLVTGLGSPKANLVIAGILAANGVSQSTTTQVAAVAVTATPTSTSGSSGSHHGVVSTFPTSATGSLTSGGSSVLGTTSSVTASPSSATTNASASPLSNLAASSVVASTAPSSPLAGQATLQHGTSPAQTDQGSASATSVGQSLLQPSRSHDWQAADESPLAPVIDQVEPIQPSAPVPDNRAAPDHEPAQPPTPEAIPVQPTAAPCRSLPGPASEEALGAVFARNEEDTAAVQGDRVSPPGIDSVKQWQAGPAFGMAAFVGSTAIVVEGYRLATGQPERKRKRYLDLGLHKGPS